MAAILVSRQAEDSFLIQTFRDNDSMSEECSKYQEADVFSMKDVDRTAMRQIERYFKHRLDEEYFISLQKNPEEEVKIRRLYEVRTMR